MISNGRGFSLVEVMLSISLLSVVLLSSTFIIGETSQMAYKDRKLRTASEVASIVIEELSFASTSSDAFTGTNERYYNSALQEVVSSPQAYRVTWVIQQDTPFPGVMDIDVNVFWFENQVERSLRIETFR